MLKLFSVQFSIPGCAPASFRPSTLALRTTSLRSERYYQVFGLTVMHDHSCADTEDMHTTCRHMQERVVLTLRSFHLFYPHRKTFERAIPRCTMQKAAETLIYDSSREPACLSSHCNCTFCIAEMISSRACSSVSLSSLQLKPLAAIASSMWCPQQAKLNGITKVAP
jgi:hypothetical protein